MELNKEKFLHKEKTFHKVFVYGTLRDGHEPTHSLRKNALMQLVDGRKFDFPMLQVVSFDLPFQVVGNVLEVSNKQLTELDEYENVQSGLYKRVKLPVGKIGTIADSEEMWVYVAGPALERPIITSGDWLQR